VKVRWGSQVWLEYEVFLDSGRRVDSSAESGFLGLRVGGAEILPGLGPKLLGLAEGETSCVRLSSQEAFGEWDLRAVLVARAAVLGDVDCADGTTLEIETRDGSRARCRVSRLPGDAERVILDFNHPLAGEPLTLFVRVAAVGPPSWRARLSLGRPGGGSGTAGRRDGPDG
jgi:FKBP-type peptidyl-prolyl cis-trans isomerase SlpA